MSEAALQIPDELKGRHLPDVLLPYQKRVVQSMSDHEVVVIEKSRRIGATWAIGGDAVLTSGAQRSAGGMDCMYIGYNLEMAREFIDTCAMWAKAFNLGAKEVGEFLFHDPEGDNDIQAYRIAFASGFEITALASKPRSLRGRQGKVIIDEAAFHDDLKELLKAAFALLIWGGQVTVISTHDGVDNPYNELIEEIRAGKRPYHLERVTLDDALDEGLYQRICLVTGKEWSPDAEDAWRQKLIEFYGDGADEELFCIPRQSGGTWLSRNIIEARMADTPVFRWKSPDGFSTWPDHLREAEVHDWLEENILPELKKLDPELRSGFGEDFGRSGDLTVIAPHQVTKQLVVRHPFLVELADMPFRQQEQVLFYIADRLPRLRKGALDARGNGQYLAEVAAQRYGTSIIDQVMLSEAWYRDHTAPFKAAFEDGTIEISRDADVLDDLRSFEVVRGVPRIPDKRRPGKHGGTRHGDAGIALLLSHDASRQDAAPIEYTSVPHKSSRWDPEPETGNRLLDDLPDMEKGAW